MNAEFIKQLLLRVDEERQMQGLSKRELSLKAGMGPNFVSQIFTSDKEPKLSGIMAIIEALGARPEWIILGQPPGMEGSAEKPKYKAVGDRLIYLRLSRSPMSAEEWARHHHLPLASYLAWEAGHQRIDVEHAQTLMREFEMSLDWLYTGQAMAEKDPRPVSDGAA